MNSRGRGVVEAGMSARWETNEASECRVILASMSQADQTATEALPLDFAAAGAVDPTTVVIDYTNYRGQRARRRILPNRLWYGAVDWHPQAQWILDAWDLEKGAIRSFAMSEIHSWEPERRE
jgi:predicted DNA-binding transcriptional regulator YafY